MQSIKTKWIEYRETFIIEYSYNKIHLLETIKNGILRCNQNQLKEVMILIYYDDEIQKEKLNLNEFSLDLRSLHCETMFQIWVYLKETDLNEEITAKEVRQNVMLN